MTPPPSHNHSIPFFDLPSLYPATLSAACLSEFGFFSYLFALTSAIRLGKSYPIQRNSKLIKDTSSTYSHTCSVFSSISYRSPHSPSYFSIQAAIPNRCLPSLPYPPLHFLADTESCFGPEIFILNLGCGIVMTLVERGEQGSHGYEADRPDLDSDGENDNDDDGISRSNKLYSRAGEGEDEGNGNRKKYLWLPARSLLVLRGAARYNWSHGIAPRTTDKVDCTIHCTSV